MQPKTVFVTGADRGLGFAMAAVLAEKGWQVFAGQHNPAWHELPALIQRYPGQVIAVPHEVGSLDSCLAAAQLVAQHAGQLDVLINNAGVSSAAKTRSIRQQMDYPEMLRLYDINSLGPLRVVEALLPLMEPSSIKRLGFVSSEAGSITRMQRTAWYSYCMSKAALNMGVKILFNHLRPEGYTFRVYHPGWVRSYLNGEIKDMNADLEPEEAAVPAVAYFTNAIEPGSPAFDEDTLVMRDLHGQVWPW